MISPRKEHRQRHITTHGYLSIIDVMLKVGNCSLSACRTNTYLHSGHQSNLPTFFWDVIALANTNDSASIGDLFTVEGGVSLSGRFVRARI